MKEAGELKIKFKKTKSFKKELSALVDDMVEDILYRNCEVSLDYVVIELEHNIREIFSKESSWDVMVSVNWSNFVIGKFTRGLVGLFGDMGYLYNSNSLFYNVVLDKINNNKDFIEHIKKSVEEELNLKFKNKFEMTEITEGGLVSSYDNSKEGPSLSLKVKTIRE